MILYLVAHIDVQTRMLQNKRYYLHPVIREGIYQQCFSFL